MPPQQQNLLLRVACPRVDGFSFSHARHVIQKTVESCKRAADKEGLAVPLAVVLPEHAHDFTSKHGDVARHAEKIIRFLPSDIWVAVLFAAMEVDNSVASNMGYFVTKNGHDFSPKRAYTEYDEAILGGRVFGSRYYQGWVERGEWLQSEQVPFPSKATPTGVQLEHRICIDVVGEPGQSNWNTVLLVSAHKLYTPHSRLAGKQCASIVNYNCRNEVALMNSDANPSWSWEFECKSENEAFILLSKKPSLKNPAAQA
ncbi:MAG: hypothetical protein WCY41_03055 [Candidatus Micrarchaeia archaeon]